MTLCIVEGDDADVENFDSKNASKVDFSTSKSL